MMTHDIFPEASLTACSLHPSQRQGTHGADKNEEGYALTVPLWSFLGFFFYYIFVFKVAQGVSIYPASVKNMAWQGVGIN